MSDTDVDVLVCLYCETPNGEIHHPLCDVRAGKPRLYKPKGTTMPLIGSDALVKLRDALRARAEADRAKGNLSEWGRGNVYAMDLVARYIDGEPAAVCVINGRL